jgi:hypothetical protein
MGIGFLKVTDPFSPAPIPLKGVFAGSLNKNFIKEQPRLVSNRQSYGKNPKALQVS